MQPVFQENKKILNLSVIFTFVMITVVTMPFLPMNAVAANGQLAGSNGAVGAPNQINIPRDNVSRGALSRQNNPRQAAPGRGIQDTAKQMIERIRRGEKPDAEEIQQWLLDVAEYGFPVDPSVTGLFMLPVLSLIDQNYDRYKGAALSLFQNTEANQYLRFAMVEVLARHWGDRESRQSLNEVFQRKNDNASLQGQISRTLASRSENIVDIVLERYPEASAEARFYYADTLATIGDKRAIPYLRKDAGEARYAALRSAALRAVIVLDPDSTQTRKIFDNAIDLAKPVSALERSSADFSNESIAMNAVVEMGLSSKRASQKLFQIARDASVAVDVRLMALVSLTDSLTVTDSENIKSRRELAMIGRKASRVAGIVRASKQLNQVNKKRMLAQLKLLQQTIVSISRGE